jgi:hypothetical protein
LATHASGGQGTARPTSFVQLSDATFVLAFKLELPSIGRRNSTQYLLGHLTIAKHKQHEHTKDQRDTHSYFLAHFHFGHDLLAHGFCLRFRCDESLQRPRPNDSCHSAICLFFGLFGCHILYLQVCCGEVCFTEDFVSK